MTDRQFAKIKACVERVERRMGGRARVETASTYDWDAEKFPDRTDMVVTLVREPDGRQMGGRNEVVRDSPAYPFGKFLKAP